MRRVDLLSSEVICLGVKYPSDHSVVDGDAQEGAKHLREEHVLGRYVHVVTDLHVLKVELCSVPCITRNTAVHGGSHGVLVAIHGIYH